MQLVSKEAEDLFQSSRSCQVVLASDKSRSTINVMATSDFVALQASFDDVDSPTEIKAKICEMGWKFWNAATEVHDKSTIAQSERRASQKLLDQLRKELHFIGTGEKEMDLGSCWQVGIFVVLLLLCLGVALELRVI